MSDITDSCFRYTAASSARLRTELAQLRAELEQAKAVIHEAGITIGSDGRVEVDLDGERFIPRAQADKVAGALKDIIDAEQSGYLHYDPLDAGPAIKRAQQALNEWEQSQ